MDNNEAIEKYLEAIRLNERLIEKGWTRKRENMLAKDVPDPKLEKK